MGVESSILIRSIGAFISACLLSIVLGHLFITLQQRRHIGQTIREDGPQSHLGKAGTPTLGGIFFILSISITSLLFLRDQGVLISSLSALIGFALIGLWDDLLKLMKRDSAGLRGWYKIAVQVLMSYALLYILDHFSFLSLQLHIPWKGESHLELGSWYYPLAIFYITAMVNACNLADGLDGLAAGLGVIAIGAFVLLLMWGSSSNPLLLTDIQESDLVVFSLSMIGGLAGFLWYNARPAQVFMGDTGSMGIGGVLAYMAIMTENEIIMLLIGAVFVMEAVSVIIQVTSYKRTGRRVFRMAPIHHHFEQIGWAEEKIVHRFWIIAVLCAALGLRLVI